jgi:hypothetical protein
MSKGEGFDYTWIDTCCIDNTSSAELSEAINSMFKWYFMAQMCYAHLGDVHSATRCILIQTISAVSLSRAVDGSQRARPFKN